MSGPPRKVITHDGAKTFIPLAAHFRNLGYDVRRIDDNAAPADPRETFAHFACFYATLKSPLRSLRRFHSLTVQGVPVLTWNRDAPHYLNQLRWRLALLETLHPFDFYASHSTIDGRRFGAENLYLGNAADTDNYFFDASAATWRQFRQANHYRYDVSFFGAMDGGRAKEMRSRQAFFAALAECLSGKGLRVLFSEAAGMSATEQVALIQTSHINLNFGASCDYGTPVASGLPERCYGIPACGGFLLCDRRTHAKDDFTPGENWAEFDGLNDCVAKIEFWLANFGAARDLAERCHAHVMAHHTYAHRAATLHQALLAWHEGRRSLIR
ncbi:MAG: glycosyltransferase [Sulfuritalea sp.]|nr:glycosyltransferase [Sulfuritalea sp.]